MTLSPNYMSKINGLTLRVHNRIIFLKIIYFLYIFSHIYEYIISTLMKGLKWVNNEKLHFKKKENYNFNFIYVSQEGGQKILVFHKKHAEIPSKLKM